MSSYLPAVCIYIYINIQKNEMKFIYSKAARHKSIEAFFSATVADAYRISMLQFTFRPQGLHEFLIRVKKW